jgi:hypothetical protein
MGMIQRLMDAHDHNPLWSMEFREAVPLIMEKLGVGAAEALQIWLRHQVVVPVETEDMDLEQEDDDDGGYVDMYSNGTDVIMFYYPGGGIENR